MMMLLFSVVSIVSRIFLRILSSLIIVVFLFLSWPRARFSFSASSVRLMYSASSFLLSWRAMVVFPTQGVPVARMTRLFITVKRFQKFLLLAAAYWLIGLASWCVAFESHCVGLEETPPTGRIAAPMGQGESLGYGAETKRPLSAWR